MSTDRDKALTVGQLIAGGLDWNNLNSLAPQKLAQTIDAALATRAKEAEEATWAKAIEIVDGCAPIDEMTAEGINSASRLKQKALARLKRAALESAAKEGESK